MSIEELLRDSVTRDLLKIVAEDVRSTVAWFGAGLSVPAKLPDWARLRQLLTDEAERKAKSFDEPDKDEILKELQIVKRIPDAWVAFDKLHGILGRETFRAEIRRHLDSTNAPEIPHYKLLLKIAWRGMFSMNLDGLCQDEINRASKKWNSFKGKEAPRLAHLLASTRSRAALSRGD